MIDERPLEVCLRCKTTFAEVDEGLQAALVDDDGCMEAWCANGVLHVCDETRADFLLGALTGQGLEAVLCSGGTPCP